jgi:hypothetical protein
MTGCSSDQKPGREGRRDGARGLWTGVVEGVGFRSAYTLSIQWLTPIRLAEPVWVEVKPTAATRFLSKCSRSQSPDVNHGIPPQCDEHSNSLRSGKSSLQNSAGRTRYIVCIIYLWEDPEYECHTCTSELLWDGKLAIAKREETLAGFLTKATTRRWARCPSAEGSAWKAEPPAAGIILRRGCAAKFNAWALRGFATRLLRASMRQRWLAEERYRLFVWKDSRRSCSR